MVWHLNSFRMSANTEPALSGYDIRERLTQGAQNWELALGARRYKVEILVWGKWAGRVYKQFHAHDRCYRWPPSEITGLLLLPRRCQSKKFRNTQPRVWELGNELLKQTGIIVSGTNLFNSRASTPLFYYEQVKNIPTIVRLYPENLICTVNTYPHAYEVT